MSYKDLQLTLHLNGENFVAVINPLKPADCEACAFSTICDDDLQDSICPEDCCRWVKLL